MQDVSIYTDCSHKLQTVTSGGQHRLSTSTLLLRLPHLIAPGVCFIVTNFQANRLRRLPAAPLNPLVGFRLACMHLACNLLAALPPAHPNLLRFLRRLVQVLSTLLLTAGCNDHTNRIRLNTQHQTLDTLVSNLSKWFTVTAASFLPSIVLRNPHFLAT